PDRLRRSLIELSGTSHPERNLRVACAIGAASDRDSLSEVTLGASLGGGCNWELSHTLMLASSRLQQSQLEYRSDEIDNAAGYGPTTKTETTCTALQKESGSDEIDALVEG